MSGGTILFLEANQEQQALVSAWLRERGFAVESALGVKEARTLLACLRVDAAIVDEQVPELSGTDFVQELRRKHPTLPLLVLHKPYTPQELLPWLEQALASRPAPATTGALAGAEDDVDATLQALREEYGARLEEKVRQLTAAMGRARAGSTEAMEESFELAHKLHGTAGSYGFGAVSESAGRLEALLKPARRAGATVDWSALGSALGEVASEAARTAPAAPALEPEPATAEEARLPQPAGTVLVADEDPAWLAEVERMGRNRLLRVVTARSPEETVAVARRQELDGAMLHVNLGGQEGGFSTAARLRDEDGLRSLPLAFFGAEGDVAYRVAATHAGALLYLPRPFTEKDLAEAVERMLATRRPEHARVLVLDDDPEAVRALDVALTSEQVEVVGLEDSSRLVEALATHRPDLLLLDVEMPGPSGFDLCRMVRSMPEWRELPIVFITAHTGVEFRVAAFQAGADDYLAKPVIREELRARVQSRLERARLTKERSERDSLTGLLLRRPFLENLRARLADTQRQGRSLALGFLDVDRFKKVNDTHGHLAGDRVLMQLGRLLSTRFRKEDLRCRWGGEEFVVALMGATPQGARDILARTAAELAQVEFEGDRGERFRVTFSAGLAVTPQDGTDVETLLRLADERLYRAKAQGGNRIET
jgi:diguanylate cyclase (GGDEF)-like protein